MRRALRTGDIVRVSCPYTAARITGKSREYATVEWPWWSVDPHCAWIEWKGQVALAGDPNSDEWTSELFRVDPATEPVTIGAACRIGIPPTLVYVVSVEHYDPPLETGYVPRPHRQVVVLRAGVAIDPRVGEQGYCIDPDDDIPITFDLVFRPYACLTAGDEVANAAGRAWLVNPPWGWQPFDGGQPHEPVWPLTLMTREGRDDDAGAAAVADATKEGSHQREIGRWIELAHTSAPMVCRPAGRMPD